MKKVLNIYGRSYEVEIIAKLVDEQNVLPKPTRYVSRFIESRFWKSILESEGYSDLCKEIRDLVNYRIWQTKK